MVEWEEGEGKEEGKWDKKMRGRESDRKVKERKSDGGG